MPERRHRNLVLGTMALLIAVLAAVDLFVLGGTTDLGRVDVVVWTFVCGLGGAGVLRAGFTGDWSNYGSHQFRANPF